MAQYLVFWLLYSFHNFFFQISNFFGLSTPEETWVVKMRIWCIKIGIVLVLYQYNIINLLDLYKQSNQSIITEL
jgi:L-asparagine transporter-like permease